MVLLGFVMAIYVSITAEGDEELKPYFAKLRRYLAGYIPIVVFTTLWTAAFYDYSLDTILRVITPYSYIFFAYPLIFIFKRDGGPLRLLKVVAVLVVGILICKAISWYCYNYSGKLVFERLLFEYEDWFRGGLQRVNAGFLIGILLAVAMCFIVERRACILQILILAGLVFFTLFVSAYRYQMLSVIAACVFGLFFVSHRFRALAACVNRSTHLQGSFLLVTTRDHRQLKNIIEHLLFVRVLVAFVLAHAGSSALISET